MFNRYLKKNHLIKLKLIIFSTSFENKYTAFYNKCNINFHIPMDKEVNNIQQIYNKIYIHVILIRSYRKYDEQLTNQHIVQC